MARWLLLAMASGAALGGCANAPAMRSLAGQTSTRVAIQSTTLADFVKAQQQLNADDANELEALNADAAGQKRQTAQALDGWTFAGRADLVAAEAAASRVGATDIVASLNAAQPSPAALADGGAAAKLSEAGTQFAAMARPPEGADRAMSFYELANAVYAALESQKAAATTAAAQPKPAAKPATAAAKK